MSYICTLCPRNCGAERNKQTGKGYCKAGTLPKIAHAHAHMWEEPCISGTSCSGTIFFSGCVLSCVFCQNEKISRNGYGKTVTVNDMCELIKRLEQSGVHNINLVSPTPYIEAIIQCFERYKPCIPVVYNTGGYEKADTIKRLEGIVDIYLPDLKYIRGELSKKYSGASDYFDFAAPAIDEMVRQTGVPVFDEKGLLLRGTVVRHLILPSNTKNSAEVLGYLSDRYGKKILVSLMAQYVPFGLSEKYPEINRRITRREYQKVYDLLEQLDLEGYVQELSSAKKEYIPNFDISTV